MENLKEIAKLNGYTINENGELVDEFGDILIDESEENYYEYTSYTEKISWRDKTPEQRYKILLNRMSDMDEYDRSMLLKIVRNDNINDILDALSNLKSTSETTWKNIINDIRFLLKFEDKDTSKFDYNKMLLTLLPLIAALAGLLIGLRKAEIADSQSSGLSDETTNDPVYKKMIEEESKQNSPNNENNDEDSDIDQLTGKLKSVVLNKCKKLTDGFSC